MSEEYIPEDTQAPPVEPKDITRLQKLVFAMQQDINNISRGINL